ncbi:protease Lon-related BREX system protein BrxL [Anabaenopsis tanganyikae CS-531]|uniref:Protease Lon-related BREX system protein BrxL n=1 Tax=Anabaenopsis tanganyikae CS-531 TaxID=2785304 RepID=A0ABT6KIX2_9CYAN|nr:protease Lon-related BREX system protein BrxL [Anabaenopsis tanganyikae]MDH6107480.1 protease Lon-related BREX system protein BrxL [Anabaenopsis tanganyikae CS-531]
MDDLNQKLNNIYPGKVVRKDLTKRIKEGANVPVYVLEYLLGMYCATDEETTIAEGVTRVKNILAQNYVRPDEAELVKSKIRELGRFTIIDQVNVTLNEKDDIYQGTLTNLGIKGVVIDPETVKLNSKLLGSGIWCILQMEYEGGTKPSPFIVASLKPIQMPNVDMDELFAGRPAFTRNEWIDLLIRSTGLEPTIVSDEVKWHLLARLIPLCENNYNSCELGPRSTGKSHVYKEVSPNSILVSGGKTTVANLFYNMSTRRVGLVGLFDVVAFDEVAGISFHDNDGVQIMKDYMASGSFARGKAEITANASMVFVGNIDQSVESLVKTSHLLAPFPEAMIDTTFFDRFHAYIPGWEIPKFSPENFTNQYGFIVDYLAEWLREMRKRSFADAIDRYFRLGNNLKQRDVQAVRKTVSGLLKLLFPDGSFSKQDVHDALVYALRVRRRVKEQLKKIGGMEFYDVHFSYIDLETMDEHFVSVPEQGGSTLISQDILTPGHLILIEEATKPLPTGDELAEVQAALAAFNEDTKELSNIYKINKIHNHELLQPESVAEEFIFPESVEEIPGKRIFRTPSFKPRRENREVIEAYRERLANVPLTQPNLLINRMPGEKPKGLMGISVPFRGTRRSTLISEDFPEDYKAMGQEAGWLLQPLTFVETEINGRWLFWEENKNNKRVIKDAWTKLDFRSRHESVKKMLIHCINQIEPGILNTENKWGAVHYFFDWLLWSLGHPSVSNFPQTRDYLKGANTEYRRTAHNRLMQVINLRLLLLYPCDYFGAILEELSDDEESYEFSISIDEARRWCEKQFKSQSSNAISSEELFLDPNVESGRLLLAASNYTTNAIGYTDNEWCAKATLINLYFYAPHLLYCKDNYSDWDLDWIRADLEVGDRIAQLKGFTGYKDKYQYSNDSAQHFSPLILIEEAGNALPPSDAEIEAEIAEMTGVEDRANHQIENY